MRSSIGIDVAAPAELVFRLARDVERWPELLPHYVVARRLGPPDGAGRLAVAFVARRTFLTALGLGLPVAWRSLTWSEADTRRLASRPAVRETMGLVIGDLVPASRAFDPRFLVALLRP